MSLVGIDRLGHGCSGPLCAYCTCGDGHTSNDKNIPDLYRALVSKIRQRGPRHAAFGGAGYDRLACWFKWIHDYLSKGPWVSSVTITVARPVGQSEQSQGEKVRCQSAVYTI